MTFVDKPTPTNLLLVSLLVVLATTVSARKVNLKVNLAGPPVDDFVGEEEVLQVGEEAVKTRYHGDIQGSGSDLEVFKTQRFARYEDLVINLPVPNGIYSVTLMFAETWKGAYNAGKRVFDVYLGSKPGGVVKVADSFDPFRSGGPAGPVRKKYDHIATYDGLTVALRPIAQNPQIAGIIVSGFSYSESFIDELPTVEGNPSELQDYSILNSIGPRLPLDPLMLYDPTQNPKLKEKKGSLAGVAKLRTPVQVAVPTARTSIHTQQATFSPSGPNAGPLSTRIDLRAQKNSLPNRPASHSFSPPGSSSFAGLQSNTVRVSIPKDGSPYSPRSTQHVPKAPSSPSSPASHQIRRHAGSSSFTGLQSNTVRVSIPKDGSPYSPRSTQHVPKALSSPSSPASHQIRRHGRRLASISFQTEDQMLPQRRDSPELTRPDQTLSGPSYSNHDPSTILSEQPYQGSSPRAFANYNVDLQSRVNEQAQALGDTQSERFPGIRNAGSSPEIDRHDRRSMNRNFDPYSQSNTGDEQVVRQAQSESSQADPLVVSQRESNGQPLDPLSEVSSAGTTLSSASMMKSPAHVPAPRSKVADLYPDPMTGQESDGQSFQSSSEGRYRVALAGGAHGIASQESAPSQTEGIDSRQEAGPFVPNHEGSLSRNAMTGDGGTGYLKSVGDIEPSESSTGIQNQRDFEVSESVRSSHTGQQGGTIESDSHASLTSHHIKMATERQDEVRNYKKNLMSDPYSGSPTHNWHNVNTVTNPDTAIRQDHQMTDMRRVEDDPATFSRPLEMSSSERDLRGANLSGFRSNNFRARSDSMTDAMSPGVHNGIGRLDGLCIDNSTHCSCGMVEQRPDAQEECLFVTDENRNPMACTIRPCNGKVICACASGASGLCQRSLVKNILVRAPMSDGMNDPTIVACRRETLEEGVMVLTPIL